MIVAIECINPQLAMKIAVGVFHKLVWCEKMLLPINGEHTIAARIHPDRTVADIGQALYKDILRSVRGLNEPAVICGYKHLAIAHDRQYDDIECPPIDVGMVIKCPITPDLGMIYRSKGTADYVQTQLLRQAAVTNRLCVIEGNRNIDDVITYIASHCNRKYENQEIHG